MIARVFAQGNCEPTIGRGQIVWSAKASGVKRAHLNHGLCIALVGGRFQVTHAAVTVLRDAASIEIFLRFGDRVGRSHRFG